MHTSAMSSPTTHRRCFALESRALRLATEATCAMTSAISIVVACSRPKKRSTEMDMPDRKSSRLRGVSGLSTK
jgi:hypothetical protein